MTDLSFILDRFDELSGKLSSPDVMKDPGVLAEVTKEYKKLEPAAAMCRQCEKYRAMLTEAEAIIAGGEDSELTSLAEEDKKLAESNIERLESEISQWLSGQENCEDRNVIVEIRGGAGGEEAALFAATVYRMYCMYAAKNGWEVDTLYSNPTELGGYKEISFMVKGSGAYAHFKYESGVHRVQRVPETEAGGRIHTSTVTVAVLEEAGEVSVDIQPGDIVIDTFRSSGAGGQHINKTESAIRITHKPTGIVVECQDERSQYKNKDRAMKILRSRLCDMERQKQQTSIAEDRRGQVGTGDRSERIRTYNFPQSRVTDHRIGLTLYRLDDFLNGDMDMVTESLIEAEKAQKLKNEGEQNAEVRLKRPL